MINSLCNDWRKIQVYDQILISLPWGKVTYNMMNLRFSLRVFLHFWKLSTRYRKLIVSWKLVEMTAIANGVKRLFTRRRTILIVTTLILQQSQTFRIDDQGNSICRKGTNTRSGKPSEQYSKSLLPTALPRAIQYPWILRRRRIIRLQPRLHDVHRNVDAPGKNARQSAGQEFGRKGEVLARPGSSHVVAQTFVGDHVYRQARNLAQHGHVQPSEDAARAVCCVQLL